MNKAPAQPDVLYRRVLLKLSGEAISGTHEAGFDPEGT